MSWGADRCESRALDGQVAFVCGHVVGLTECGGGECCLAGKTFGAVAFHGAVIATSVGAGVWLSGVVGLAGRSCGADVLGKVGWVVGLIVEAFAAVVIVSVVKLRVHEELLSVGGWLKREGERRH